jgi:hypothetical protein
VELSPEGRKFIEALAQRYGVSTNAVETMALAVTAGGGTMAQFNHPELGGGGQWMAGGMTMVGDMFNYGLKAKVDGLCQELSSFMANGAELFLRPKTPDRSQVSFQTQGGGGGPWWPSDLGSPSSTGAQNNMRYAYFPSSRRLAIDRGDAIIIFDTLDHQIGGFGQQQGSGASFTFTSQYGVVPVSSLPQINGPQTVTQFPPKVEDAPQARQPETLISQTASAPMNHDAIFSAIERLKDLADKGIITEAEFQAKKNEMLARL